MDAIHDIEALTQRQLENEISIITGGIARYRANVAKAEEKGHASETVAGMWMLKRFIDPVSKRVKQFTDDSLQGKPGVKAATARIFDRLDPDVCAFVGVKVIQNMVFNAMKKTRMAVAYQIGSALREELQFNHMQAEDSRTYKYWVTELDRAPDRKTKQRIKKRLKENYSNLPDIDEATLRALGNNLVQFIIEETGMVSSYVEPNKNPRLKPTECLQLTDAYRASVEKLHSRAESMWPRYEPMLCPPKPWDGAFACGFVGELGRRTKLVRTHNRSYLEDINNYVHKMPRVISALNAIQATPFRINKFVLDILGEAIASRGGAAFSLPPMDDIPLPEVPADIKTNKAARKLYANAVKPIQRENNKNVSKRFAVMLIRSMGEKYRDESAIWFAHNLDWRGRVYPLATCLSPQGDDLSRALLQFANGYSLGTDEAVEWLAIHGAGCFGYDKVSFSDRVRWVKEHEQQIRQTVENPMDYRWWAEADKPWMFLAWCHEWVGCLENGKEHVSRLAIAMDGSCNGLQNFAAMLRHEETARAVNLAPSETPNDIYQNVADKVKAQVDALAVSDRRTTGELLDLIRRRTEAEFADEGMADEARRETACLWDVVSARWIKDHITRKLVKRPVMTYPYSVTMYGMRDQLIENLLDMREKTGYPIEHVGKVAGMLKVKVYNAICETVTAAARAMDWLKAAAKVVVKDEKPVSWVSPIGMLVLQDYRKSETKCLNTRLGNMRLQQGIIIQTAELDSRKQAAGIAPNFVHSCDASHLMFTVNACMDEGVTEFQMIHDSYGAHPHDAAKLARILREQFISMYGTQDVLAEFQAQLAHDVGSEIARAIPDSPTPETFDLYQVMNSKYFFA